MNIPVSTIAGIAAGTEQSLRISPATAAWAKARGISRETLAQLDVASGMAFFPDAGAKSEAVFFRYPEGWKARPIEGKTFVAGGGFKLAFWNIERVLQASPSDVYIVEGEMDACALVEAGIGADRVLSVPNGAKAQPTEDPKEARGYSYVEDALKAGLARVKRFVWCGDNDPSGLALRADMVKLLGAARFSFVEWPEGVKDANDMLRSDGGQALYDLVKDGALSWPIDGIYRLSELPEPAPLTLWRPGFDEWESKVLLAPRTLSVVTGHPGHGKTALWGQIWYQIVKRYEVPACIASFETRAKPHLRRQLRTLFSNQLERDMDDAARRKADEWINNWYLFVVHPESRPSLEWLLDMWEVAVVRHGARILQVDPWNRLEAARAQNENETDYIGRCLRTLHSFAHDMNCHVQILAHPSKMEHQRKGQPPVLEDISGSKNWDNMVDQGFTIHRPEVFEGSARKTECAFYHRKARFDELGHPCKLKLDYKLDRGRYVSIDYQ